MEGVTGADEPLKAGLERAAAVATPTAPFELAPLLLLFVGLVFLELPGSHLIEPDEARYAEIPREMLASGDWVTPRVNGQPYFEKPPLFYWGNALFLRAFGENPYAARLTSRLSSLAVAVMLLLAAPRRREAAAAPAEGALAALVYLSSLLPFLLARQNLIDGLLTAAVTACLLALREFAFRRDAGRRALSWLALAAVAAAAGTLAKGLVAVVLPGLAFTTWAVLTRRARLLREIVLSPAPLIFLAITVPWFAAMERANDGFLEFFFVREHLGRFTGGAKRGRSVFYFIPVLLLGFLPWTLFGRRVAGLFRPFSAARLRQRSDALFFLTWAAAVFLFFSLSRSKLVPYVLPMFPALAALTARALLEGETAPAPIRRAAAATALVLAAVVLAQPRATRDFTAHPFVAAYRRYAREGVPLVTYHTYLHGLPWELRRAIPMASWVGELRPAYERDMHHPLFWQEPTFWYRWNAGERLVVLTRARDRDEFRLRSAVPLTHLLTVRDHVLLANFSLR